MMNWYENKHSDLAWTVRQIEALWEQQVSMGPNLRRATNIGKLLLDIKNKADALYEEVMEDVRK